MTSLMKENGGISEIGDTSPWKLTNVPWKSIVGSDVFPIEIVPF